MKSHEPRSADLPVRLVGTREAARLVGLKDPRTIRTYIKKGLLANRQTAGGQYRVDVEELLALLTASGVREQQELPSFDDLFNKISDQRSAS